ncbi:hypothetical protein SAY87_006675 [Trapa incisa]|uniref:S-protein homolog n=1 Tax=Trapa incisa TaxID=236973 RepID=A0AAN7K320_9MYRT|nr:hypothetical protein SAY87_006675 [Trapa incisa]
MLYKNKTTLVLLRPLLITVAAAASSDGGEIIRKLIHVEVVNMLLPGHSFGIHCKSKDDDLGNHIVGPNQRYGFEFRDNFLGTTLFFCGVKTEYGEGVYEIFTHRRDEDGAAGACGV